MSRSNRQARQRKERSCTHKGGEEEGRAEETCLCWKTSFKPTSPQPLIGKGHSTRYTSEMFLWNSLAKVCVNETRKLRSLLKTTYLKRLFVVWQRHREVWKVYFSENFRIEDKEVKPPENFRLKVIGETTLRMASTELPRQGCHFMNALVLIARFTKRTGSLGGTSKIRIIGNRVVFLICIYIYICIYIWAYT